MSLKRMAMKLAITFAAAKGYEALQKRGGLSGVRDQLARNSGGSGTGGLGGLLGSLAGGGGSRRAGGGLGSILGALAGGQSSRGGVGAHPGGLNGTVGGGGLGGLLGGLAAMAGGSRAVSGGLEQERAMEMAESGPQSEDTARAMIRAIAQAVRADGEIDAEESRILHDVMGDMETPEERSALDAALREPVDPEALARDVPVGHESEVYAAALTAIDPDRPAETAFLASFARALRLRDAEVAQLHEAAGKPR